MQMSAPRGGKKKKKSHIKQLYTSETQNQKSQDLGWKRHQGKVESRQTLLNPPTWCGRLGSDGWVSVLVAKLEVNQCLNLFSPLATPCYWGVLPVIGVSPPQPQAARQPSQPFWGAGAAVGFVSLLSSEGYTADGGWRGESKECIKSSSMYPCSTFHTSHCDGQLNGFTPAGPGSSSRTKFSLWHSGHLAALGNDPARAWLQTRGSVASSLAPPASSRPPQPPPRWPYLPGDQVVDAFSVGFLQGCFCSPSSTPFSLFPHFPLCSFIPHLSISVVLSHPSLSPAGRAIGSDAKWINVTSHKWCLQAWSSRGHASSLSKSSFAL